MLYILMGLVGSFTFLSMMMLDISPYMNEPLPKYHIRAEAESVPTTKSRGVVICLFDAMIPMTISLIQELRTLGYSDVIQLYHCNGELSALSQTMLDDVDTNIEIVDGCVEMQALGKLRSDEMNGFRSFWLKPLALVHTRLDEVILMDADDLVFLNPSRLFDTPGYKETGTIFFYDREILKKEYLNGWHNDQPNLHALIESFDYAAFGLEKGPSAHLLSSLAWHGDAAHEQDSSIVVVQKSKAGRAMDVLWHILQHDRHRNGFTYGDKELFWIAYELAHQPYFFSPWANSGAEKPGNMANHPDTICGAYIFNPYSNNDIHSMTNPDERTQQLLAEVPSFVSKRRTRSKALNKAEDDNDPLGFWPQECLVHRGSEPMRPQDVDAIRVRIKNAVAAAVKQQQLNKAN
ncbi:hypothetical protein DYB32_007429 [Aphanomyces invadans]|uniref:Nucleotide-diphospho-sugar transferase n=1 Tax=Aphanomyces invadans TaxID=157072 RepID=A0A418ANU4_9STRA|nr:hypothetical protein DYB32_007429 [Aphanomyces invadans]